MTISIHQPNYIPWIGYFSKIKHSDGFVFLDDVQYIKNGFIDRNRIKTPQGSLFLKIPVTILSHLQRIDETKIKDELCWRAKHLKTIELNYRRSKYYFEIFPIIEKQYLVDTDNLAEFNSRFIILLMQILEIDTPIYYSRKLNVKETGTNRLVDIVKQVGGTEYLSGQGGQKYQDDLVFKANDICLKYSDFKFPKYAQLWNEYIPNLSVLDTLFNCGIEESKKFL